MTTSTSFKQLIDENLTKIILKPGNLINAKVTNISSDYVTVDAGLKSESDISIAEFMNQGELTVKEGDETQVLIEQLEMGDGIIYLSREKAHRAAVWERLEKSLNAEELVEGTITDKVKGGFTVEIDSVKAFLPGSQVDIRPVKESVEIENQTLEFKIMNMDKKRNNIVVSRRAVLEKNSAINSQEILDKLSEGGLITGIVKNLTDYGAFVDLGGLDGLLHITDISWKRVKHPSELLEVGQELEVKILSFDKDRNRVSLGMKQLSNDPWKGIATRYSANSRVFGKVTNITDYGCFVEIENGIEGLVHMSEMDWTNKNIRPNKIVNVGDEVEVMILDIEESKRRISLGIKQCIQNPWTEFCNNHEVNETISGNIKSITDFGIFVGLEGSIDGLIHINDISWTKAGEDVIRNINKNDEVTAKILSIDPERERISLSMKDIVEDPFVGFSKTSSPYTAKVIETDENKVIVQLDGELAGFVKLAEFNKDNVPAVGDNLQVYLLNYERKSHLINLTLSEVSNLKKERTNTTSNKASMPAQDQPKNFTLGDLIKDKMNKSSE
jgi:small subunit ribosomal protein S1